MDPERPESDPVERWGTLTGHLLGAVAAVGLLAYLVMTYL